MPGTVRVSWREDTDRGLWALSDPRLSNSSQDKKEVLLWSEKLGSKYSSLSLSPTHLSHTRNITLSRIKCERYIFIKKCIRSFIEVRHYVWLCSVYICIVVTIQHTCYSVVNYYTPYEFVIIILLTRFLYQRYSLVTTSLPCSPGVFRKFWPSVFSLVLW